MTTLRWGHNTDFQSFYISLVTIFCYTPIFHTFFTSLNLFSPSLVHTFSCLLVSQFTKEIEAIRSEHLLLEFTPKPLDIPFHISQNKGLVLRLLPHSIYIHFPVDMIFTEALKYHLYGDDYKIRISSFDHFPKSQIKLPTKHFHLFA